MFFKAQNTSFSFILYHLRSQLSPKLQRLKTGNFFSNAFFFTLKADFDLRFHIKLDRLAEFWH
jgi:hypothetical protein